jgi:hypothetical protein
LCEITSYDLEIVETLTEPRTGYDIIDKTLLSMQTKCNFRNLRYSHTASSFTTASVLVVLITIITIQENIESGNVNVNFNETGVKILHRGIAVSEKFDHPYLNDTHRVIILPIQGR